MAVTLRSVSISATLAGEPLDNIIGARGSIVADSGWQNCSVFVTEKPGDAAGLQEAPLVVTAGAGNNVVRFTGVVRRYRPNAFPKSVEIIAQGNLVYADEWAPSEDIIFEDEFPRGAHDEAIVAWALDHVPNITYDSANLDGWGAIMGAEAPDAFTWRAGQSAWNYIKQIDRASLFRTFQAADGTIRRALMVGHPNETPDFTISPEHILDGATLTRDTQRTRNYVKVLGYQYDQFSQVQGEAWGSNPIQGPGDVAATRHAEEFSSNLIELGVDEDGGAIGTYGVDAQLVATWVLSDVNKAFVEASIPTWLDGTHEPGMTVFLAAADRLLANEPLWLARYDWEVGDNSGWTATYGLTGGGLAPEDIPTRQYRR